MKSTELKQLIDFINKKSNKKLSTTYLVNYYFQTMVWSVLKDEWSRMSKSMKKAFIKKLSGERK